MTLQELRDRAEPGPWRDYIDSVIEGQAAHEALFEANKAGYERFYDTPQSMRSALDDGEAAAVEAIESSSARFVKLRDGIYDARISAFVSKAGELGAEALREGEPVWVRLMRDLHELRVWRREHLDGVDLHLPPFILRSLPKGEAPGMFDTAFRAWAKAIGVKPADIRARVIELASAGLIPGVADAPERNGYTLDQHGFEERLASLVEREGADAVLAQARLAAEVLPVTSFPVPAAAFTVMEAGRGPRP